jgi:hypothetical protein
MKPMDTKKLNIPSIKLCYLKKNTVDGKIENILINTLNYYETSNYGYSKAQIMFHIADFYFKKHSYDTSLNYISQSINISAEKQYISFLEQNFIEYRYLLIWPCQIKFNQILSAVYMMAYLKNQILLAFRAM